MKARLNNMILKYETERLKLKQKRPIPFAEDQRRLKVIDEIISALSELKRD